jgi:transcriptional regulator with XRE-family HTH domain
MDPGSRLRSAREQLGLTYRDVERASYELAGLRGRPEFIIHISRLADFENRGVTPSLYKLYSLAAIYHLDPVQVCDWYEVPFTHHFADGSQVDAPRTHLAAAPTVVTVPSRFDPGFDPRRTQFLSRMVEAWGELEGTFFNGRSRFRYGYIGIADNLMEPLLRSGSLVLVDPLRHEVVNSGWRNEYERPIYFIELRDGYRCGWCLREGSRIILQPHPLSSLPPETHIFHQEAEVIGQVIGAVMRLPAV